MTGFEPWTSGIGSDRSTNWATTTALPQSLHHTSFILFKYLGTNGNLFNIGFIFHFQNFQQNVNLFECVKYEKDYKPIRVFCRGLSGRFC